MLTVQAVNVPVPSCAVLLNVSSPVLTSYDCTVPAIQCVASLATTTA
jgi:hypothetical protein